MTNKETKSPATVIQKLGFTMTIAIVALAAHGANDLRKNLHYGNNAMAATIDSNSIQIPEPLFTKDEIKKMEKKS